MNVWAIVICAISAVIILDGNGEAVAHSDPYRR